MVWWKKLLRSPTIKSASALISGQLFAAVVGVVCSFVQLRLVGPVLLGTLQSYGIVTAYLSFLHLGTFTALQRELPYLIGRQKQKEANLLAATCFGWTLIVACISGGGFFVLGIIAAFRQDWVAFSGWGVQAVAVFCSQYAGYLTVTYRTGSEFVALARTTALASIVSIVSLPLLILSPYHGMCGRSVATNMAKGALLHFRRPFRVAPAFNWGVLKQLIAFGLPLSVFGYIETSLWVASQNYIVLKNFEAGGLGLLAFVTTAQGAFVIIPMAINQVYMPRIAERFGAKVKTKAIVKTIVKPTIISFILSFAIAFVANFAIEPAIKILLPKYLDATNALRCGLFILPVMALRLPRYILIANQCRRDYAVSAVVGFLVGIGTLLIVLQMGMGLEAVVLAYLLGQLMLIGTTYIQIGRSVLKDSKIFPESSE